MNVSEITAVHIISLVVIVISLCAILDAIRSHLKHRTGKQQVGVKFHIYRDAIDRIEIYREVILENGGTLKDLWLEGEEIYCTFLIPKHMLLDSVTAERREQYVKNYVSTMFDISEERLVYYDDQHIY